MRPFRGLLFPTLFLCLSSAAQTSPAPASPAPAQTQHSPQAAPIPSTISTGTQLVVVDVTVLDRSGTPVRGLKQSDFMVEESKKPQAVKSFDEHAATDFSHLKLPPPVRLPTGTFTNYTPIPPHPTLNVLLLDTLNTPMKDQAYVRFQLQQYIKKAIPGTSIAIFGLTNHLILLQGFSSDPEILKNVVEHKLLPRASNLLDDAVSGLDQTHNLSDTMADNGATDAAVAGMAQFESENATFQTSLRTRYTLDAFANLAHFLAGFPGRKNLIWFSGAFPLTIFPDANLDDPFAAMADFSDQVKETTSLLDKARVAVYPVDARGLQTSPVLDASTSGAGYVRNPQRMGRDIANFNTNNAQEHMAMDQIADDTGGHAFYNNNDLAAAVNKALIAGANYYTLTYSPSDHSANGAYRKIHVALQGDASAHGYKLAYRSGYYAADAAKKRAEVAALLKSPAAVPSTAPSPTAPPATGSIAYAQLAMQRGAPNPSDILFKVRVLPSTGKLEDTVAPHNAPNPNGSARAPYRRYDVDFAAIGSDFTIPPQSDGHRHGAVEFLAFVYDVDGKLLNVEGDTLDMNLEPATYAQLMKTGIGFHLQVSAPAKKESFIRIGIHDIVSGRMGVVEVPTSAVDHLAPLPPAPAPATPPAAPAPTQSTPAPARTPPSLNTPPNATAKPPNPTAPANAATSLSQPPPNQ